jgi:probable HAF family extracellular repeat protein
MKSRFVMLFAAVTLFAALAIPIRLTAQDSQDHKHKHHHYKLIDMGTFGGPASFLVSPENSRPALNSRGTTVGGSSTNTPLSSTSDPFVCGGDQGLIPNVNHAFVWQDGVVTDLGALAPVMNNCSLATSVNASGEIAGISENSVVDPLLGFNEIRAVIWRNGEINDLGMFGGTLSLAVGIDNRGQVIGGALNDVPDPFSVFDFQIAGSSNGTQTRAFVWKDGRKLDLGTLGGPDAFAAWINEPGQIVGSSYTNDIPNSSTGFPTYEPFLWENGEMQSLGSLGGVDGFPAGLNNRGQVIGGSSLAVDPGACFANSSQEFGNPNCHPFLWDHGKLVDLNTSSTGGNPITVNVINDAGEIVGGADFSGTGGSPFDAYLWRNGVVTDLGNLGDCASKGHNINSQGQVVGATFLCDGSFSRAFLWENGSIVDLNTLIPPGSSLALAWAMAINDREEIAGIGVPTGVPPANLLSQGHAFLLIPCDEHHPNVEGCDYSLVDAAEAVPEPNPTVRDAASSRTLPPSLLRRMNRYRFPGPAIGPKN